MTTKIPVELSSTPGITDSSNATAITIDSSENVGIGTTPATGVRLDIRNDSTTNIVDLRNANASGFGLYTAGGSSSSQYALRAADKDNNALFSVMSNGNVGIGTTSPDRMLHVKGTATSTVAKFANTGNVVYIELNAADQVGGDAGYIAYNNTKDMAFWTDDTERMRIDSTGDVFIGTTSHMSGGSNAGDAVAVVNGGVNREGIPFTDFDEAYVSDNRGIFEGTSGFQPSNNPGGSNWWHVISRTVATGGSATYITQTATSITGNIHTRYSSDNGSSWSSWQSV